MAKNILEILSRKGAFPKEEIVGIKREAQEHSSSVEDVLLGRGVSERDIALAKSELFGIDTYFLEGKKVPYDVLKEIPEESARFYSFIPLDRKEGVLEIGMVSPDDLKAQDALKFIGQRLGVPFRSYIITPSDFESIVQEYKSLGGEVTKALSDFEKKLELDRPAIHRGQGEKITEDAPITKMVGVILRYAVEGRASDVHIEPLGDKLRVRFRVDGVLYTGLVLPGNVHAAVVTRIKIMTNLKIDELRIPQDGRFHARVLDKEVDFRVSTFPTSYGEKVAIRILDPDAGIKTLADLGIEGRNKELLERSMQKPYGMILVTGPTGSGKSTTLYAMLQILNQEGKNIVSLEDPIEYYMPGMNQSQVRPEIGYDFATGLRHILRQDPDIIMVGEIRDKETAQLAVHAALTGHLVLSTLHTNNALGVIPRLLDMGVDPFLIPSTVILAIGQRLVRRLCAESRKKVPIEGHIKDVVARELAALPAAFKDEMEKQKFSSVFLGEASATCPKGSRGRIGVYEVLEMTPQLEKIVLEGPSETKIGAEALRQNMITMRQDGVMKALRGIIGVDELLEVI